MTTLAQIRAIQNPDRREHFIYWAYDAQGVLLYIGCTMQPEKRLAGHRADRHGWTTHVVRYRAQGPYNYETARRIEREAIREHQPPFNSGTSFWIGWKKRREALFNQVFFQHVTDGKSTREAHDLAAAAAEDAHPRPVRYAPRMSA